MVNVKTGPTRDWTDPMNLMVMLLAENGRELTAQDRGNLARDYKVEVDPRLTHIYKGSLNDLWKGNGFGVSTSSVRSRLETLGWLLLLGMEKRYQGKAVWLVRNEFISKEDASRADTLFRRSEREKAAEARSEAGGSSKTTAAELAAKRSATKDKAMESPDNRSKPRYEVRRDESHPGNEVVRRQDGPGEYERMNREIVQLSESLDRASAERDDYKDEAEKYRAELEQAGIPALKARVERAEAIARWLLQGGTEAEMLRAAVQLAKSGE